MPGETVLVSTGVARRHIAFCAIVIAIATMIPLLPIGTPFSIDQRDARADTIRRVAIIVCFAGAIAWFYASAAGRSRYLITDKRILVRVGLLTPATATFMLESIVSLERQSHLLTPITGAGHILFMTVDRGVEWRNVANAAEIEQLVNTLIAGRPQDVRRRQAAAGDDVIRRN